ncbi:MAG: class I SAM-dependent methyltransferase [Chloroflexi bacterium]|nr:class I SAM-dependent methyltransferase [Chloroflexota bacterium]
MDEFLEANRKLWDAWAEQHAPSDFYDVQSFRAGRNTLKPIELDALGDVQGQSLLHLQCHFGLDTLSWARLGAEVTGVDFSARAIELAKALAGDLDIAAEFVCSDVYNTPQQLNRQFDIVFTSYGVLTWLPDLRRWASVVAQMLKPGGTFLIVEFHPLSTIFDDESDVQAYQVRYPYFNGQQPIEFTNSGESYAARHDSFKGLKQYEWQHSLSDIIGALLGQGMQINAFDEYPYTFYQHFPFLVEKSSGQWHQPEMPYVPLMFSLKATH